MLIRNEDLLVHSVEPHQYKYIPRILVECTISAVCPAEFMFL